MGACGSKTSPLLDDGPAMMPGLKPIGMVPTGSTIDDLVESNILEADDIEDIFPLEREPSSKELKQEQQQGVGSQRESIDGTTTTSSLLQLPNGNPSKIIGATPAESPLPSDKNLNLKALHNISPPSSSMKLGEGLATLEVPVKSPRNTKTVSAQESFQMTWNPWIMRCSNLRRPTVIRQFPWGASQKLPWKMLMQRPPNYNEVEHPSTPIPRQATKKWFLKVMTTMK